MVNIDLAMYGRGKFETRPSKPPEIANIQEIWNRDQLGPHTGNADFRRTPEL